MPTTIQQLIEHTDLLQAENCLKHQPQLLNTLVDYISTAPNPLLQNQQECYLYPSKAAEILSSATTFRALVAKSQQQSHPFLHRIFDNWLKPTAQKGEQPTRDCLLGYSNKVLVSLAKKTPEIYEYFKENQQTLIKVIRHNELLEAWEEFWVTFSVESTMGLYLFLKNLMIRTMMFRIIDESDLNNLSVYSVLIAIYEEVIRKLELNFLPADELEELEELCYNFHDEDFVALLLLKVSAKHSQKTYYIARFLNLLLVNPINKTAESRTGPRLQLDAGGEGHQPADQQVQTGKQGNSHIGEQVSTNLLMQTDSQSSPAAEQLNSSEQALSQKQSPTNKFAFRLEIITDNYIPALEEYLQAYEESEHFMDFILTDQLEMLSAFMAMSARQLLQPEYEANLLKRLLVYSSIHKRNSILHCMLYRAMTNICESNDKERVAKILEQIHIIPFLRKNWEAQPPQGTIPEQQLIRHGREQYYFGSLVTKICKYWYENREALGQFMSEVDLQYVENLVQAKSQRFEGLSMFKSWGAEHSDLSVRSFGAEKVQETAKES